MVVKTQDKHPGRRGAMGLHVGVENVQQYFPQHVSMVELEFDHLQIACLLEPSFWQGRPEIHDPRLSSWLESKRNSGKLGPHDAAMTMVPCGISAFKLQIGVESRDVESRDKADHELAAPPTPAYFCPVVTPAALLERRKRSLPSASAAMQDRRRTSRLKGDDRTSFTASH